MQIVKHILILFSLILFINTCAFSQDSLPGVPENKFLISQTIYFATDQWDIDTATADRLIDLINLLRDIQVLKIRIEGHTDKTGEKKYNLDLSKKRAQ